MFGIRKMDYFMIAIALAVFLPIALNPKAVRAHDPLTHQANEFSKAKNKSNGDCCDGNDYTYVNPYSWERTDKGFRVYVGERWIDVPADAEVGNMKNPDGNAKVWLYYDGRVPRARCFMPGAESSYQKPKLPDSVVQFFFSSSKNPYPHSFLNSLTIHKKIGIILAVVNSSQVEYQPCCRVRKEPGK